LDFSKQIQKAEEAFRRRNYDFAVEVYQQLLEIDPDQGDARSGLRQALKKRHEKKKGGKFLRALGGAGPLAMAKTLRKAGKHAACAKSLESYLAQNPVDADANLMLGQSLEAAGFYKSARAVYEFVAEIDPRNPEGLKRAGAMSYRENDHRKALDYYERALDADPRDQEALKARKDLAADMALKDGGYESLQHSRDAIKDKDEAIVLERSRRRHMSQEDLEAERERLEGLYADTPSDVDNMLELATIHERLKDYESALDMVERALTQRRDSFDLLCRAGDLRLKLHKRSIAKADKAGEAERAGELEGQLVELEVEEFKKRVDMHPGDSALRLKLGKRLMRADDLDAALGELQKAHADARIRREAMFLMAQCFQRKGFTDLARKEYERSLEGVTEIDDRAKEVLYNLGTIAETEGDAEEARSMYVRVYEVDIGYRDVAAKMEQFR
jgi:tetratricopeptide (TPR) repeat protein